MKRLLPLVILSSLTFTTSWGQIKMCLEKNRPSTNTNLSNPKFGQSIVAAGKSSNLLWDNGSTLKIKFIGGNDYVKGKVKKYATEWTNYVNLTFEFVESGYAHIRISFEENGLSYSHVGRNSIIYATQSEASMNFGWFNYSTPEDEFSRTILHEFGHALGFYHEHQHPTSGIPWDEDAVYKFYAKQGWDKAKTKANVIDRYASSETQFSAYDPISIMHYPIDNALTVGNYEVGINKKLSLTDINFAKSLYPGKKTTGNTDAPILHCRDAEIKLINSSVTITVSDVLNKMQAPDPYSITKSSVNPSTFYSPGDYSVTVSATSSNGQTSSCVASVKVLKQDVSQGPRITCKNHTVNLYQGVARVDVPDLLDFKSCPDVLIGTSLSQYQFNTTGVFPVVVTAVGNTGKSTQCAAYVTVNQQQILENNTCGCPYDDANSLRANYVVAKIIYFPFTGEPCPYYIKSNNEVVWKNGSCAFVTTGSFINQMNDYNYKGWYNYKGLNLWISHTNLIFNQSGTQVGYITSF